MKKVSLRKGIKALLISGIVLGLAASLVGCGSKDDKSSKDGKTVLKVGATATPHAEILAQIKDDLAKEGVDLQVTEYSDYIIPNTAVQSGELDANYFQHLPYLEDFNKKNKTDLVSVAAIHYEPMSLYAGKTASLDKITKGVKIAIPNDPTNEARALLLLQDEGLIKLKEGVGLEATPKDIAENKNDIKFVEVEAAAVPRAIGDVDFAIINGNYALAAGLTSDKVLAKEAVDSLAAKTYANIVAVKKGNENKPEIKALVKALKSEKVKKFIEDKYKGSVVAV